MNADPVNPVTPFPLAMVICDHVYRDPFTAKFTLIGTFSTITGRKFPLKHPHLFIYASLTGGRGQFPIRIEVVSADDEQVELGSKEAMVDAGSDPRAMLEAAIAIKGLTFPKEGEFRVMLYANNEFMVERRLLVIDTSKGINDDE